LGDRLAQTQSLEKLKLAAGAVILSPYIPLLFMGEEYGENAPFRYFVHYSDEALAEAVRKGRQREFSAFDWKGEIPDPQAASTFLNSKIDIQLHRHGEHKTLFGFYKTVIDARKKIPAFCNLLKENMEVKESGERALFVRRWFAEEEIFSLYNFSEKMAEVMLTLPAGTWEKILDSSAKEWGGPGETSAAVIKSSGNEMILSLQPCSLVVYQMRSVPGA
jgi:maltooligosyltrehalose trehalohydrolase